MLRGLNVECLAVREICSIVPMWRVKYSNVRAGGPELSCAFIGVPTSASAKRSRRSWWGFELF